MKGIYQPIPGLGTGSGSLQPAQRVRVFAGPDHLLLVYNNGYSEDYKRVFYRDIRFVLARKSNGQAIQGLIAGVLLLLGALLFLTPNVGWIVGSVVCVLCFLWLGLNLSRGPSCQVFVNTTIQTIRLPAPTRWGKLPVLIDFLRTHIPTDAAPVAAANPTS